MTGPDEGGLPSIEDLAFGRDPEVMDQMRESMGEPRRARPGVSPGYARLAAEEHGAEAISIARSFREQTGI